MRHSGKVSGAQFGERKSRRHAEARRRMWQPRDANSCKKRESKREVENAKGIHVAQCPIYARDIYIYIYIVVFSERRLLRKIALEYRHIQMIVDVRITVLEHIQKELNFERETLIRNIKFSFLHCLRTISCRKFGCRWAPWRKTFSLIRPRSSNLSST